MHIRYKIQIIFIFVAAGYISSYSQIQLYLQTPPPFQFKVEDLWKITISNPFEAQNVYVIGEVSKNLTGELLFKAKSSTFEMQSGITNVSAIDIKPIDMTRYNSEVEKTINRIGTLPSDEYLLCVYVVSQQTNETLGSTCEVFQVLNVTQADLLSPQYGESALELFPSFQWLPPAPLPVESQVTYEIKIVEILERQSPEYAVLSNPIWFSEKDIKIPLFQYPMSARELITGREYAWQVCTYINGVLISLSEIWIFKYEAINENISQRNEYIKSKLEQELSETLQYSDNKFSAHSNNSITSNNNEIIEEEIFGLSKVNNSLSSNISPKAWQLPLKGNAFPFIDLNGSEPTLQFIGSYGIEYQFSDKVGTGSQLPRDYLNIKFDPTLILYGIPISVNLYYSTLQQKGKQNINSMALSFNQKELKKISEKRLQNYKQKLEREIELKKKGLENNSDKLSPDEIKRINDEIEKAQVEIEKIKSTPELYQTGGEKLLSSFNTFGIGTNYPKYTDYTLSGAKVTGLDFEFNPSWIYLAFSGWNNLDAIPGSNFKRKLVAGRIGGGAKNDTHLHLTLMKAWDDQNSLSAKDISQYMAPKENFVISTNGLLTLFNNMFEIGGEFAASVFTRDINGSGVLEDEIPSLFRGIINPNISSQIDYSYEIFSSLDIRSTGTKISGEYKMVGPGYISLGAPSLRKDVSGFKVRFDQSILNKVVRFSAQMQRERNNLISQNKFTSVYYKYDFNLKMNFKDAPYLIVSYRPNFMSSDKKIDTIDVWNNAHIFSLMTGLNVYASNLTSSTNFLILIQSSSSSILPEPYMIYNFTVNENLTFSIPLSLNASLGFITYNSSDKTTGIVDFSTGYSFFQIWKNSLGVNYSRESERNSKLRLYFSSNIPIWELGNLALGIEKIFYREDVYKYGDKDEFVLRASINKSF